MKKLRNILIFRFSKNSENKKRIDKIVVFKYFLYSVAIVGFILTSIAGVIFLPMCFIRQIPTDVEAAISSRPYFALVEVIIFAAPAFIALFIAPLLPAMFLLGLPTLIIIPVLIALYSCMNKEIVSN